MATYGFNFRSTSGYVTDSAPDTYSVAADAVYPITRNGITFGWVDITELQARDRSTGVGARFAGTMYTGNVTVPITFRVDLPAAGSWRIRVAFGDAIYAQPVYAQLKENGTAFSTIDSSTSAANKYVDATGVERSSPSDWTSNNAPVDRTFASTIFQLTLADGAAKNGVLAHLDLEELPPTTALSGARPPIAGAISARSDYA